MIKKFIEKNALLLTLLLFLVFMFTSVEQFENQESSSEDKFGAASSEPMESPSDSKPTNFTESKNTVTPLTEKKRMGPYDGLCVRNLSKVVDDLVPNDKLVNYFGNQIPVQNVVSDNSVLSGPNVDGDKNSPQRLSMLANNYASLNCCPSTYSTDKGCVCLTKKQTDFLSRRGYNNVTNNVA